MRFYLPFAVVAILADVSITLAAAGGTELVSVRDPDIAQLAGTQGSRASSLSFTGRYVAFESEASDLVPGDTNAVSDVFVYDREKHTMERVSVRSDGTQARSPSTGAVISADGMFVAFTSDDFTLVPGPHDDDPEVNDGPAVFLRDRSSHTTVRVRSGFPEDSSIRATSLSAHGRYVATELAEGDSGPPHISVAVYDRRNGSSSVLPDSICRSASCSRGSLSADGTFIAFRAMSDRLEENPTAKIFILNRRTGQAREVAALTGFEFGGLSLSAEGRFLAFGSAVPDLVPNDTNLQSDVFVFDRITGVTTRVSVSSGGAQANGESGDPVISADGEIVAFTSRATNLVPGDTNVAHGFANYGFDIFVHHRSTGRTSLISRRTDSQQSNADSGNPAISADGLRIAFDSVASNLVTGDVNAASDVFVRDRARHRTTLASRSGVLSKSPPGRSYTGIDAWTLPHAVSESGGYVAFLSDASSLVGHDRNGIQDIFVRDRVHARTVRANVSTGGAEANNETRKLWLSDDGRYVAFESLASNLVAGDTNGSGDVFVRDMVNRITTRVSVAAGGRQLSAGGGDPSISGGGRYVVFTSAASDVVPGDTNNVLDIFLHDRQTRLTTRVSVDSGGNQANGDSREGVISANGRYVAFASSATNLGSAGQPGIFVRDLSAGTTTFEDVGRVPMLSGDGRFVVFERFGSPGGIFVRDRQSGITRLVASGARASISATGRYITFDSPDESIAPPDTNHYPDVFLYDQVTGLTTRVSVASDGAEVQGGYSTNASISADGRYVVFTSGAQKVVPDDVNGVSDVFIHQVRN